MNIKTSLCSQEYDGASLVEEHASLVKRIAYHLISRLPASVLVDDLIQAGMIGLLEAAKTLIMIKGQVSKLLQVSGFEGRCSMIFVKVIGRPVQCIKIPER